MLYTITLLTSLLFSFTYPLCFWISHKDPLKNNFHHFHIGLPTITGVMSLIFAFQMQGADSLLKVLSVIWVVLALFITAFYWKKETVSPIAVTVLSLIGLYITYIVQSILISSSLLVFIISVLGGLIFVSSLYAMNLGHWYLNVHGLPIVHLRNASYVFWALLLIRLVWDLISLFVTTIEFQGDIIKLYQFIGTLDGFLLIIPIFFGTLFPFGAMFMVREIIKLKNTQATTGVLYVILCGVLLGDMAYKYYLIKFGIIL